MNRFNIISACNLYPGTRHKMRFFIGRTKPVSPKRTRVVTHIFYSDKENEFIEMVHKLSSQKHNENRCMKVGMDFDWRTIAEIYEETLKKAARVI